MYEVGEALPFNHYATTAPAWSVIYIDRCQGPWAGSGVPRPRSERTYDEHPWTPGPQCVCVTVRVACSERLSLSIRIAQGRNVLALGKGSPFSYGKRFTCFAIASIGVVSVGPSVELSAFSAPQMDEQANISSTYPVPTDPTRTDLMTPGRGGVGLRIRCDGPHAHRGRPQ